MDIKQWLEVYANNRGWRFVFGRRAFHNLEDALNWITDEMGVENRETFLFMDPYTIGTDTDGNETYRGSFMVLTQNNLDLEDDVNYELNHMPLIDDKKLMVQAMRCTYDFVSDLQSVPMFNELDLNASGFNHTFNLKSS